MFDNMTPANVFGMTGRAPEAARTNTAPGVARSAVVAKENPWHPDSPLFWFGAIAAVCFGLVGVSTSGRVGPFKAKVQAGKS